MPKSRTAPLLGSTAHLNAQALPKDLQLCRAGAAIDLANSSGRLISYVLSDTSVARDNHVILADAWDLRNFLRNPVMPWAHDTSQPPIAKWIDIATRGSQLVGTAEYADAETYPFADTIFRLVKGGFLNAVSVSWIPRDWKFTSDRSRPGGIDFFKVELLEVSQVPVPALPTALVTARAQGIDTGPLYAWAERMLDTSELAVLPRTELEQLRREAKMPTSRPNATTSRAEPPAKLKTQKRSLWHVGWLAMLLEDLGYLQQGTEYEAAIEEDGSPVPGQLLDALKALGAVLVAMTIEEVNELVAGDDEDDAIADVVEMSAGPGTKRAALAALRRLDPAALSVITRAMNHHLRGNVVTINHGDAATPLARAGRVLSADNERCLREAHDHMTRAVDMVRGVVDQCGDSEDPEDEDPENDDDNERAVRERRARAIAIGA